MPAIASLEDLKAAQKDLLEAKDLNELKKTSLGSGLAIIHFIKRESFTHKIVGVLQMRIAELPQS